MDSEDPDDTIYYDKCLCYKREDCYWDGLDSSGRLKQVLGCGIAQKMQDLFDLDDECWDPYFVGHTEKGKTQVVQVKPFDVIPTEDTHALNEWIDFARRLRNIRNDVN